MIDAGAQFAYDSIPDKLARESAVLAGGVTKGLFAAVENIYENPGQTAIQVATGVAISALVAKAGFLKLPALAMAVYGGGESLFKARDFVAEVSPAVADVWRNPSVSKSTTDHLESQISDGTAGAAITGASFFLANKGFAALESSAPNNSLGRLLFDKEPVSFRFPRHAVHLSESGRPELELLPFKPRELARLVNRETRDVTYNAYSRGPFKDAAEATAIGKRPFIAKSQVYTIAGTKTEVVIPDWLDKRFDQVRGLERELSFPRSILNIGKLDALKTQLAQHPLSQFAKPEDILTQLSVLPDTRYTPRVTVSPYSLDIFARNILPKGASTFESPAKLGETIGMAVRGESQTYLKYNKQRPVGSGKSPDKTLRHEWAHQVEFKDADYDGVYGAAAFLERDGFNLTKRARVQRHSENQAVHMGEGILSYPHQPYEATAVRAPIRSAVMAVKLRRILDAVPEEDRGLFHQHYLDRVQRMEKIVFPEARKQLSVTETKSDYMKEQVERLLSYLKPKDADVVPY